MRVLFLNFEYPPIGGGGANANAHLFRELAREPGVRVDAVTAAWGGSDETVDCSANITLHRLAVGKKSLHFWTEREIATWLWRAHRKVGELSAERRYDLVHAFFGFPSGALAWCRRRRLPYIVSLRGSDVPGFNPRFGAHYRLLTPLFRRIWRGARHVVANSEGLRALARRTAPELSVEVIPNGVDTEAFFPAPKARRPGHLLCVSRLVERKGVRHLLEAMPQLVARAPEATLTFVGEGDLERELQARAAELGLEKRVMFLGYVPHERLPDLYRSAELYVQPSFYEGMSNTVLEAMASGLPVVASGAGGHEELFEGNARLAPYGEPDVLAGTMGDLLADPDGLRRMGERSREIALGFSWRSAAERYLELYRRTAEGRG